MNQAKDYVGQTVKLVLGLPINVLAEKSHSYNCVMKSLFQGIVVKADVNEETFELAKGLTQESSVFVTGVVQEDTRSKLGYELLVKDIELIGESHEYQLLQKSMVLTS